jgi:hypothetical protein
MEAKIPVEDDGYITKRALLFNVQASHNVLHLFPLDRRWASSLRDGWDDRCMLGMARGRFHVVSLE